MENENSKSGLAAFLSGKGFYIVLVLCVIAIGISGYILLFTGNDTDSLVSNSVTLPGDASELLPGVVIDAPVSGEIDPAGADHSGETEIPVDGEFQPDSSPVIAPADFDGADLSLPAPDESAAPMPPAGEDTAYTGEDSSAAGDSSESGIGDADMPEDSDAGFFTREDPFWVWPVVSGDIVNPWSLEALVFNPTLGDWRVHDGVDIESAPGSDVMAVSDGLVSRIYQDALYGVCVEVDHKNGFVSTVCGLTEEVAVTEGQAVTAGQVLGRVGSSAQAEQSGGHVHLKMTFEGRSVDPAEYIG